MIAERRESILTEDGIALEGLVAQAPIASLGLVACHPHPLYGGDMENPVVVRVVEVARDLGLSTVRFNFRGVGGSGGQHGGGQVERADVRAALAHLATLKAPPRRVLVGYSFGADVAAAVAPAEPSIAGLALIAPPIAVMGESAYGALAAWPEPVLIVAASRDAYAPVEALERLVARLPTARLVVIDGADHFFLGRLHPMGEALRAWLAGLAG